MTFVDDSSPPYVKSYLDGPYSYSIASSASSSSSSVWSHESTSSQTSDDTSATSSLSDTEYPNSYCCDNQQPSFVPSDNTSDVVPPGSQSDALCAPVEKDVWTYSAASLASRSAAAPECRRNPRRTSISTRSGCPPSLVRQSDRKVNFVDSLVGKHSYVLLVPWRMLNTTVQILPLR